MLPAYIIEELRRRENARREQEPRPTLDLPLPFCPSSTKDEPTPQPDRGVVIIDVMG